MWAMPALLTRMSTRPSRRSTSSNAAATARALDTSQGTAWVPAPIDEATAPAATASRSRIATRAPWRAKRRAIASPMPEPAPVTTAVLPERSNIVSARASYAERRGSFHAEPAEIALLADALQHPAEEEGARRQVDGV